MEDYRGNIIFFTNYGPSLLEKITEKIVATKTHGPYVHCEIVADKLPNGRWRTIGAHASGIAYGTLPREPTAYRMADIHARNVDPTTNRVTRLNEDALLYALEWARGYIGSSYSMIDNFTQAVDLLWASCPVHLTEPGHFNCSNFCTAFLDKAEVSLPKSFIYPFDTSPNDLAEWFGLLPNRKKIRK